MKITYKNLLLALAFLSAISWQPSHHFLMQHGMSMNSEVHTLVTIIPFLSIMFALGKAKLI